MDALENIITRRSYRAFKPEPVYKGVLQSIFKTASHSPSYMNTQPWEIAVVSGEKKDQLVEILLELAKSDAPGQPDIELPSSWPPHMEKCCREYGATRLNTLNIDRFDKEGRHYLKLRNFEFYGAPHVVFLFMDGACGPYSIFDMGLYTQNFVLTANAFGVGTCIQAVLTVYAKEIKKFLKISEDKKLVVGISMGYPDIDNKFNIYQSAKRAPEEYIYWYE